MGIMTGWYIVDKLESNGKYTTWNTYDCSMLKGAISAVNQKKIAVNTLLSYDQANDFTV